MTVFELRLGKSMLAAAMIAFACLTAVDGYGQQGAAQAIPRPIVIPNRTLDSHELKELAEKNERKKNYERRMWRESV